MGAIVLALTFLNPWAGAVALLASAAATAVAMASGVSRETLKTGLYGLNGALVGLVATWYVPEHPALLPVAVAVAALSAPVTSLWIDRVSVKTGLPVLTLPFLALSLLLFLVLRPLEPALTSGFYEQFAWTQRLEEHTAAALPGDLNLFLRSMSWLLFQNSVVLGIAVVALVLWRSRITALVAFLGYVAGLAVARSAGGGILAEMPGIEAVVGFNAAFVVLCVAGMFVRLTWLSVGYGLLGAAMASLLALGLARLFSHAELPVLNAPFLIVTIWLLALARAHKLNTGGALLTPVPLTVVSTPERTLELPWGRNAGDQLKLSLPFYGVWYVAQGTHGLLTHWGDGSYAWDFVVMDTRYRSCRGLGRRAEDYYAWGLPIIAPAPGRVVRVVGTVSDNIPPEVNKRENWGNHIIIDHGGGLYSELSHFRRKGIVVVEGQAVARGQLLGYLGNSGLSMEPHLHYQLQRDSEAGAKSAPAKFWGYYQHKGDRSIHVAKGSPQQGDLVGGPKLELPVYVNGSTPGPTALRRR